MPKAEASTFVISVHTHKADGTPAQEPFFHLARVSAAGNVLGGAYLGPATLANARALYESLPTIKTWLVDFGKSHATPAAPAQDATIAALMAQIEALKAQIAPAPATPAPAPKAAPKAKAAPAKTAEAELEDLPWA